MRGAGRSRREEQRGIDEGRVEGDAPVQVRAGDAAGLADLADDLSGPDALARLHVDRAQVAIHRDEPFAVVDEDRIAAEEEVAGVDHAATGRRADGGADRSGDVHAAVRRARLAVEGTARAE